MPANMMIENGNLRDIAAGCILSAATGAVAGGTVADSRLFAVRNISTRPMAVSRIDIGCRGGVTAYAAVAGVAIKVTKAHTYSAIETGGTGAAAVVAQKRKTSGGWLDIPATEITARVAGTDALVAGTNTPHPQPFFLAGFGGGISFGGNAVWEPRDGLPQVLEAEEGLLFQLAGALPATGTSIFFFGIQFFRF